MTLRPRSPDAPLMMIRPNSGPPFWCLFPASLAGTVLQVNSVSAERVPEGFSRIRVGQSGQRFGLDLGVDSASLGWCPCGSVRVTSVDTWWMKAVKSSTIDLVMPFWAMLSPASRLVRSN